MTPGRTAVLSRLGLVFALLAAVALFSALRPQSFFSIANLQNILNQSAAPAILAIGVTFALIMGDFDLSVGAMFGLAGACAVVVMATYGLSWMSGVLIALVLALAVGLLNGYLIAFLRAPSFITTLAIGTVLLGVEFLLTDQRTIYEGVDPGFRDLAVIIPGIGLSIQVILAAAVLLIAYLLTERSEAGRYMFAIGSNREAARLAGVPIRLYRALGFVFAAMAAGFAGILSVAPAAASTPNAGAPYLLPAFAAAFLGSTAGKGGRFTVLGTALGVVFLGVVSTGLATLGVATAVINIIQGAILVAAVLLGEAGRRATGLDRLRRRKNTATTAVGQAS